MARSANFVAALFALAAAVAGAVSPNYEPETAWQAIWLSKIAYCDPSSITPAWDCDACAGMPNFQPKRKTSQDFAPAFSCTKPGGGVRLKTGGPAHNFDSHCHGRLPSRFFFASTTKTSS